MVAWQRGERGLLLLIWQGGGLGPLTPTPYKDCYLFRGAIFLTLPTDRIEPSHVHIVACLTTLSAAQIIQCPGREVEPGTSGIRESSC